MANAAWRRVVDGAGSGQTKIKGVPKAIPFNTLAHEALCSRLPRMGRRFFSQWKNGNSFKHTWTKTCERAGVHDLHFHDLRHIFTTWLTQCGVDYAVIQTLKANRFLARRSTTFTVGMDDYEMR